MNLPETTINEVASFWDNRPCNIRHSSAEIGTKRFFDEVEKRKYFIEPHIPVFAQFDKWHEKKVLEIGCGLGTDAVDFARAGAIYTGVELSEKTLELAKKRFDVFGLRGTFLLGNSEALASFLPIEPFDLVYSFGVIHHTPHPYQIINQLKAYMGSDSELRLMLYAKQSWKQCMIDAGFDQPEAASGCPIATSYRPEDVRELLKDFTILSMEQDHIFPYVVEKYVQYEYELQPWFKAMSKNMFRALEKKFGWHMLIKAKKNV